jgi:RNA polymerase sigma-70 factor (ECF subfamily)
MQGFEQIYENYFRDVFLYIRSLSRDDLTAEEIAEETFFKALKSIDSFDERCDIRTWLIQIAKNTYYTYLKKSKRQAPFPVDDVIASDCNVASVFEDRDTALRIHKFLFEMHEPYKEVFTLRVFAELPHSQIAELFGKTESWSRVTYHRAKAKIIEFIMEG